MTTACIAVIDGRGFRAVSIAHDGHLANIGGMLLAHYADPERIERLLEIGTASSLRPAPSEMAFLPGGPVVSSIEDAYREDYDNYYVRRNGRWQWRTCETSWYELDASLLSSRDVDPDDAVAVDLDRCYRLVPVSRDEPGA